MSLSAAVAMMALVASTAPASGPRTTSEVIMPPSAEEPKFFEEWGFSEAVIDGDRVYLSGVVAGLPPGQTDQSASFDRAFRYIARVLERSGSSWDNVVDMTTYHTDLPSQMKAFVAVKNRYVRGPFPAWTAIDIDRLVPDNGLVEIKVVARRNKGAAKKK
jgi:enamine deaminase RidA (YjgF/YER057c/UK114 family)